MTDSNVVPFNPLDKRHLGESVGQAMLRQPVISLGSFDIFDGAGIYAIYYTGDFRGYEAIAKRNRKKVFNAPIYIGKAVPKGARKGGDLEASPGKVLYNRLKQHAKSIDEASNLSIADFHCRYLIVDDIWIPLGESLLIAKFDPLWNKLIDGFGNHDPGSGRHAGLRPRWDVLHPGRPWAERCQPRGESAEQITLEALDYLRSNPPPDDPPMVIA
ncbi:MAG: Eco29kI family restriction endonuclease [Candidatus Competibacteraceae bacterium]|uniref:Restriction endonuclease, type II, Eco29kI n=1 Tax=Candidatus Contendobacter odensis Run_B_J11 TaxID=1400861 RepID=A0A7U7G956_9GAMM|nr:Eco29kI family restriction endonuclease [Candidatus Contendobacter odensis]MBK8535565.1 Eco29kI family restriction endonuclease [Candidatus Competibacteraceae bacterium]MBK8755363.1 Eco29kI family restriction endonuclease [Candidatus Competibacteraceae bacterium]CDH43997.1 Restriction endonuclease, type II, Eco29kI [Candidatus Contendobacter odensis Run_B_J11]